MNNDKRQLTRKILCVFVCVQLWLIPLPVPAAEHHGQVKFGGLPIPGVTITATRGDKTATAITDAQGAYAFPDLGDGNWQLRVEMPGFTTIEREVAMSGDAPAAEWDLKMLSFDNIKATAPAPPPAPATVLQTTRATPGPASAKQAAKPQSAFQRTDLNATAKPAQQQAAAGSAPQQANEPAAPEASEEVRQRANEGFLINGSNNNGASSPFALAPAFGNNRQFGRGLYNGNLGVTIDNSAFDARSFSLTGQDTAKPAYNNITGMASIGGPIKIPHLVRNGPNFFIGYQWLHNRNDKTLSGLMPTLDQRDGSAYGLAPSQISPQAEALLKLYPLPNFVGGLGYNYQIPAVNVTHQDSLQARMNKTIGRKNQVSGVFALQSTRTDNPNIFGFLDTGSNLGMNLQTNWRHNFSQRLFGNTGFQFSRLAARVTPFFANRENIAGSAGISGNNQEPIYWGPPNLNFLSGITALADAIPSFTRNQTAAISEDILWNHGRHNISFGGDFKRQEFNSLSQQDPRGTFTFTGTATGNDFQGFLLGIPDTSSIAYGNADKYFRASIYEAYVTDDWRMSPGFTLNAGIRWEYNAPITELYGRLVNLDIAPGFTAVTPVCATAVTGCTTASQAGYPSSLVRPDKHAFQPRVGFSWRPLPASSMVVRGGYGVYYNTSVYQALAAQMAQQSPLSKSFNGQSTPATPLSLATGLNGSPGITPNTFALDPNLRVGYSQNWQLSVQRDLPAALVATVTYLGIKGTRGMQEFYPNTYPAGAVNPCQTCPSGFAYLTSNGNSTRQSGQVQLRRRLHNGFTANLTYTFSKSIDDSAALGGRGAVSPVSQAPQVSYVIAQNWLDLSAERALSTFDQRHLANFQIQYTTGMGVGGGTLVSGWKGALFKEWTFVSTVVAGSGLPLTPVYPSALRGTAVTGPVRPDYTGLSVYDAPAGLSLNPKAFAQPASGQWGNAGRDSITGPNQFSFNASMQRTFRLNDRFSADFRLDSTNALNHVTFPNWNTTVGSNQFGLPTVANAMRVVQTTVRVRF